MKNKEFKYKIEHSLEERKNEANRILNEYQNRLPIICEVYYFNFILILKIKCDFDLIKTIFSFL